MNMNTQVARTHYQFGRYMYKRRWISVWHQLDEVVRTGAKTVLEIGPGPGLFKAVGAIFGLDVKTVDIDPALNPDYVASAMQLPLADNTQDVTVAFQMLEHLPYDMSLAAFREMVRVSSRHIIISLPDAREMWFYSIYIPKVGNFRFMLPKPAGKLKEHAFDGQHYWEVNKRGYELEKIINDLTAQGANLARTFRVGENPYHRFFMFEKPAGALLK